MYYKKGLHIGKGHDREMFEFIKQHSKCVVGTPWLKKHTISNDIEISALKLPYAYNAIREVLEKTSSSYCGVIISQWEASHPGFYVQYGTNFDKLILVLQNWELSTLLKIISESNTYEDYKKMLDCSSTHSDLVKLIEITRDFDCLCDSLRYITAYLTSQYISNKITGEELKKKIIANIKVQDIPKSFWNSFNDCL